MKPDRFDSAIVAAVSADRGSRFMAQDSPHHIPLARSLDRSVLAHGNIAIKFQRSERSFLDAGQGLIRSRISRQTSLYRPPSPTAHSALCYDAILCQIDHENGEILFRRVQ